VIISHELAKEAAAELGLELTVPHDECENVAYWRGFCSSRTERIAYGNDSFGRAFNAGIEERVHLNKLRRAKLGWVRYTLSRFLRVQDWAI